MPFTLVGALHAVMDEQTIKTTLRKREFVLKTAENTDYPQLVKFELINDRCRLIDGFGVGHELEVTFSIKGREWVNPRGEKQYFVSLEAFKVGAPGRSAPPKTEPRPKATGEPEPDPFAGESDLPF